MFSVALTSSRRWCNAQNIHNKLFSGLAGLQVQLGPSPKPTSGCVCGSARLLLPMSPFRRPIVTRLCGAVTAATRAKHHTLVAAAKVGFREGGGGGTMTKVAQITGEGGRGGVRGGRGKLSGAGGRKAGMENDGPLLPESWQPHQPTTHTTRCCLFLRESDSEPWRGGGRGGLQ